MRVLAIDPAIRNTGYAIFEFLKDKVKLNSYATIKNSQKTPLSDCLKKIHTDLCNIIRKYGIQETVIEKIIYVQNFSTAITMGSVRGTIILSASINNNAIYEYTPKEIKNSICGNGSARKEQVVFMTRALLNLSENPSLDEADAIALGICHYNNSNNKVKLKNTI